MFFRHSGSDRVVGHLQHQARCCWRSLFSSSHHWLHFCNQPFSGQAERIDVTRQGLQWSSSVHLQANNTTCYTIEISYNSRGSSLSTLLLHQIRYLSPVLIIASSCHARSRISIHQRVRCHTSPWCKRTDLAVSSTAMTIPMTDQSGTPCMKASKASTNLTSITLLVPRRVHDWLP